MAVDAKSGERDLIFWTTIVIAFVLLVHNGNEPQFIAAMLILPVLIFAYLLKPSLWPILFYLLIFGFSGRFTRYFRESYASDTLPAIRDYIGLMLAGKNVYNEVVMAQRGPTPFTYLPFSLFWYLPAQIFTVDLRFFEMIISGFVPVLLAAIGRVVRSWRHLPLAAVVSLTPFLLDLSADGSNDNSAVFLLLTAILLFIISLDKKRKWAAVASAIVLGLSAVFKHYIWFFLIFFVPYLYQQKPKISISVRSYLTIFSLTVLAVIAPFVLTSPGGFWRSLFFIEIGNFHNTWGWNVWVGLLQAFDLVFTKEIMWVVRTGATMLTAFMLFYIIKFKSLTKVIISSALILFVYLMLSNWTTYAYFTFLLPIMGLAVMGL